MLRARRDAVPVVFVGRGKPGLRGLDTGCVHHGRDHDGLLTGWLPDEERVDPFGIPDEGFWQVRARARYYIDATSSVADAG